MESAEKQESYADFYQNPNITDWEKYKYYVATTAWAVKMKETVREIVRERGLISVMNDAKWLKLQSAVKKLPFPPAYLDKLLTDTEYSEDKRFFDEPQWYGDWKPVYEEGMPLFFMIEYIRVRPRYASYIGQLVKPIVIANETEEFERLLQEIGVPYEEHEGFFTIFGYK